MDAVLRAVAAGLAAALVAAASGAFIAGCAGRHASAPHGARPITAPAATAVHGTPAAVGVPVVPRPRYARVEPGLYAWPRRARIALRGLAEGNVTRDLRGILAANGVSVSVTQPAAATERAPADAAADVTLQITRTPDAGLGDEGYALHVDRRGVTLRANTEHGLFYALRTLEQMSTRAGGASGTSPNGLRTRAVTIVDRPEYRWRGIHLDVARHFFPVPVVERYIDLAARYKLNTFHWHLTDDQAWRLRSRRYPALGAGSESYSEADVREVVAYAARRYVTVVPELDMPAHADAALRAYPNLACGHGTLCTTGAGLAFAHGVLGDAAARFPSPYLHAGGDEVPPPALAAQPRFTNDLEGYLRARGRRLVGWDEILTPRLSPRAVVMVWTSRKRAAEAARHGNDVVVASGALYFDAAQGDPAQEPRASAHMATLEQVYAYVVTPSGLSARETGHVLGAQANLWTEHVATPEHLFYMALPRELALAEVLWTPRERKNWDSFLTRLPAQLAWLDAHGYPFRIPNASFALAGGPARFQAVPGHVQSVAAWTSAPALAVTLSVPLTGAVIRYTTDGSAPSAASRAYRAPFTVALGAAPVRLRAAAFYRGRAGAVSECALARTSLAGLRAHRNTSASWSALVSP
jgi:hexosaminidase